MQLSNILKVGAIVISGIALAFLAGYVIFSYFNRDAGIQQSTTVANTPVNVESDSEGISDQQGEVAGVSTDDTNGITTTGNTNQTTSKPAVSDPDGDGITPSTTAPAAITVTEEDRRIYRDTHRNDEITYVEADDGNDDSEITLSPTPEVNEEDDYFEYVYTFEFNNDAQDRYEDGFTYSIDGQSCDDSDFFTSDKYDFKGKIEADDIDDEVTIKVRIKDEYIDDSNDFEDSSYKFDGKNYTVKGDINVPQCEN